MTVDIRTKIREAASKNAQLLQTLGENDYAPPALKEQTRFINNLNRQIQDSEAQVKRLENLRIIRLRDREKYRDSFMRRFLYKASGQDDKFAQKAEKEEREYFDVLQKLHQAEKIDEHLHRQLDEQEKARDELVEPALRHGEAQGELDYLYIHIFAGPTPGFPEEDALEQKTAQESESYREVRKSAETEEEVRNLLIGALQMMHKALTDMDEALSHSRTSMVMKTSILDDLMERNALNSAQRSINQAALQVYLAKMLSPHVQSLPFPEIAKADIMTEMIFNNLYYDMLLHKEMKRGVTEVQQCVSILEGEVGASDGRKARLSEELRHREKELESARAALQTARAEAFERVMSAEDA